jgi:hypothetical protein
MLVEATTNQLIAARHLFYLAEQNIRSEQTASLFAGVNLLQDAVETFLWAAATHKGASGRDRSEIHQLFDAVNEALSPRALPFRHAITQLNRLRINSKHYGIHPDRKEAQRLSVNIAEFLRESTNLVFDLDFWTVSLIHLLSDDGRHVKYWLLRAEKEFRNRSFQSCLTYCRYAIYLEFEQHYDISPCVDPNPFSVSVFGSVAPVWALNERYINERVTEPCEFIVINYEHLHRQLWENGIDPTVFWNVRRLTPEVYLPRVRDSLIRTRRELDEELWIVKHDLGVFNADGIEERAAYVLRHTIEMMLSVASRSLQMKTIGVARPGQKIILRKGDTSIFIPLQVRQVHEMFWT